MDVRFQPGTTVEASWDRQSLKAHWSAISPTTRVMLVVTCIIWVLPILWMAAFWYLFWYLPVKLLRKRSAMERGRHASAAGARAVTEQKRRSTASAPAVHLVVTGLDIHSKPVVERRRAPSTAASTKPLLAKSTKQRPLDAVGRRSSI